MKKLSIIILCFFSCNFSDKTETAVGVIKECIREGVIQDQLQEYEPDIELCICNAINVYCGTDFDTSVNQWWYDIQDWVNLEKTNYNSLLSLSTALIDEGKKMEDELSKKLIYYANEWINEDILKIRN